MQAQNVKKYTNWNDLPEYLDFSDVTSSCLCGYVLELTSTNF
jgi:hypothetical protein